MTTGCSTTAVWSSPSSRRTVASAAVPRPLTRSSFSTVVAPASRCGRGPFPTTSTSRTKSRCPLSSTVHQAKEALGGRLRDLRKDAGLTGTRLALLAGWHSSKVSKIEYGKQAPSEEDLRTWCGHCGALDQVDDLIATARDIEAMYVDWRR